MPSALEALNAKAEITRAEFCGIAVNAYKAVSGKAVFSLQPKSRSATVTTPMWSRHMSSAW